MVKPKKSVTKQEKKNLLKTDVRTKQQRAYHLCALCKMPLFRFQYERHMKNCKEGELYKAALAKKNVIEENETYKCSRCAKSFSTKSNCVAHAKKKICTPKMHLSNDSQLTGSVLSDGSSVAQLEVHLDEQEVNDQDCTAKCGALKRNNTRTGDKQGRKNHSKPVEPQTENFSETIRLQQKHKAEIKNMEAKYNKLLLAKREQREQYKKEIKRLQHEHGLKIQKINAKCNELILNKQEQDGKIVAEKSQLKKKQNIELETNLGKRGLEEVLNAEQSRLKLKIESCEKEKESLHSEIAELKTKARLSILKIYQEATDLLVNKVYDKAVNLYNNCIEQLDISDQANHDILYKLYIKSCTALNKLNQPHKVINSISSALNNINMPPSQKVQCYQLRAYQYFATNSFDECIADCDSILETCYIKSCTNEININEVKKLKNKALYAQALCLLGVSENSSKDEIQTAFQVKANDYCIDHIQNTAENANIRQIHQKKFQDLSAAADLLQKRFKK